MVRVKSEAYTKAATKAPRKQTALRSDSARTPKNGTGKSSKYSGGNTYCPRLTPDWQKPITSFFSKNESQESAEEKVSKEDIVACSSVSSPDPVPGCSKDSDELIEAAEELDQVSDEESKSDSCSKEKLGEEESCSVSGSSESGGPEK